jgi:hypothetical protein
MVFFFFIYSIATFVVGFFYFFVCCFLFLHLVISATCFFWSNTFSKVVDSTHFSCFSFINTSQLGSEHEIWTERTEERIYFTFFFKYKSSNITYWSCWGLFCQRRSDPSSNVPLHRYLNLSYVWMHHKKCIHSNSSILFLCSGTDCSLLAPAFYLLWRPIIQLFPATTSPCVYSTIGLLFSFLGKFNQQSRTNIVCYLLLCLLMLVMMR